MGEGSSGQKKQQEAKAGARVAGFRDGKEVLGLEQRSGEESLTYQKDVNIPHVLDHCTLASFLARLLQG